MVAGAFARGVFEPEVVLPTQFYGAPSPAAQQPEKRLMLAVLEDAVVTLYKHAGDDRARAQRLVREVLQWIEARNQRWPFSFENICAALNLNASALRQRLRRMPVTADAARGRLLALVGRHVAGERHRVTMPRRHRRTQPLPA